MDTAVAISNPVLPFIHSQQQPKASSSVAADHSLLEIDRELDVLFDQMQDELEETGVASPESVERFHTFCDAYGEKVDRIGRFIRVPLTARQKRPGSRPGVGARRTRSNRPRRSSCTTSRAVR